MSPAKSALLTLISVASAGQAWSAGPSNQLEEVIVSARRVDERLLDVPISVTVLSGATLDDFAVTRWEDVTLPGIKIGPAGIMDVLSIRGIASGINFGFEQSAPVFIDGVWFGSSRSSRIGFLDTERVEVLKGPQPTYFGKNAIAGAFGIVTRKPQPEFGASIDTYYEFEHDEATITGVLNVPVGDHLAARVAGRWRDLQGYMTNSADSGTSPHQEDEMGRLALRWQPVDALTVDAKIEYSHNVTSGRETQYVRCVPQAFADPRLLNPAYEDCRMDTERGFRYDRSSFGAAMQLFDDPNRPGERIDNELLSGLVAADWSFAEGYAAKATVAYYDQDFYADVKQDHSWNQRSLAEYQDASRLSSQELRLNSPDDQRWTWTLGGYHEQGARDNSPFTQLALQVPANQARTLNFREDSDSWAVFADVGLRLGAGLTLKAGGRYTQASRDIVADREIFQVTPNVTVPGADPWSFAVPVSVRRTSFVATRQSRDDDELTPAVSLEWRPRVGRLYYLSWREGFKAGGFDSFLNGPVDQIGFEPETVEYWEAGLKLQSGDGSWRFSSAAFHGDYADLQVGVVDPTTGGSLTRNAGGALSQGIEFEGAWAFANHWQVDATLAYLDSKYSDFEQAPCYPTPAQTIAQGCVRTGGAALPAGATLCQGRPGVACAQDLSGFPTSFAPEWSGNVSLQYQDELDITRFDRTLMFSARVDVMYTDDFYTTVNGAAGSMQPSYAKLDARVALAAADGHWEIALVGRNLTNEVYGVWYEPLVAAGLNTGWFATTARPRQLGLQARLGF